MSKFKTVTINDNKIKIRKWKGKDKRKFLNAISKSQSASSINTEEPAQGLTLKDTIDILVNEQIVSVNNKDKLIPLSHDQYRYLLSRIRVFSLGNKLNTTLLCEECGENFNFEFNITDVLKARHSTLEDYDNGEVFIKFGPIRNIDQYLAAMEENMDLDMFFHIEEFNGSKEFSINSLIDEFDDLDLSTIDDIVSYFEDNKFKVLDVNEVTCPHCEEVNLFEFDEIPGFFPDAWFEDAFKDMLIHYQEQHDFEQTENKDEDTL